ncbi:uncharacterized protein LOC129614059 [Condylostylus longicornis]|uniref:uncharacterized protein LOC129614059 n=1 Tax=Condylostylus longicornis TaxID=2530218 RepID=UPI00244E505D|nr:uncharacterized protein LOC129614059 [Condylostylus longicornis]
MNNQENQWPSVSGATRVLRIPGGKTKNKLNIGTWNVQSLYEAGKLDNTILEMTRLNINILGISEMRWPDAGELKKDDATVFYSGNQNRKHSNGVGMIIKGHAAKCVSTFIPHSDRTMLVKLSAKPVNINLIQVYAPTADKSDEAIEEFYHDIDELMKLTKPQELNIVLGDFNAKVGSTQVEGVTGHFGLGDRNERGDRLIQFCQENKMKIANTWFSLPPRRLYTWKSPQDNDLRTVRNQIDFILVNRRFGSFVSRVSTYPGADVRTDHNLLLANIKIKLAVIQRTPQRTKLNVAKLKDISTKNIVTAEINQKLSEINLETNNTNDIWTETKVVLNQVAKAKLGNQQHITNNKWMTEEIIELMNERRKYRNIDPVKYKQLNGTIQRKIRWAKTEWLNQQCQEIERLQQVHDDFNLHKKLKEASGIYRKKTSSILVNKEDKVVFDIEEKKQVWEEYIKDLFSDSNRSILTESATPHLTGQPITKGEIVQAIEIYKKCEAAMGQSQFGFKAGMGTREALFCTKVLVENCKDVQKDVFICFIDYEKAFDRVQHDKLIEILQNMDIDQKEINCIQRLYWKQTAEIKIEAETTREIEILRGVRQGCILSPILFNVYSENIFKEATSDVEEGIKVNGININNIRYADDTTLIAGSIEDLQTLLNKVNHYSKQFGLHINIDKTKYMVVSRKNNINNTRLFTDNKTVERVTKFKYLGCWLNESWDSSDEIRCRIEVARAMFFRYKKVLTNHGINIALKVRFVKCYVWSVLLYGMETWTLKVAEMNKIEAFEMWLYRRILKIPWIDRVSNAEVLRRINKERELLTTIKRRKAAYFGHVMRNSKYHLLQLIIQGKIQGKRGIGRKQISWLRNIRNWTGLRDLSALMEFSRDRERYKEIVNNIN